MRRAAGDNPQKTTMNITTNITMTSGDFVPAEVKQNKPLKLEYGKHYRTRSGVIVGPLEVNESGLFDKTHPFLFDKWSWQPDGRFALVELPEVWDLDLIEEVVVEPEQNMVKLLPGDGYRLLAEGEVIEDGDEYCYNGVWRPTGCAGEEFSEMSKDGISSHLPHRRAVATSTKKPFNPRPWNQEPTKELQDARSRIVELEAENVELGVQLERAARLVAQAARQVMESRERIAELEALKLELEKLRNERPSVVLLQRVQEVVTERDNWQETAALHSRNEQFYRDLLGQCAKLLGDECRRCDDGRLVPADDFLALKVPEVLEKELRAGADIARENDELHRKCIAAKSTLESVTHLVSAHISLGHELFGSNGTFEDALVLGQDVVLDGMKWMRDEILRLREADGLTDFPENRWSVVISDGFCAFRYDFGEEAMAHTCVHNLVSLIAMHLQAQEILVSRKLVQ